MKALADIQPEDDELLALKNEFDQKMGELDEDKLLDYLEPLAEEGGTVVDFHGADLFPERWFDLVLVLTTDNTLLYDRLTERGYTGQKLTENVECEIMQVVFEEARESYAEETVHKLDSNNVQEMESNVERVAQWLEQWRQDHGST